MTPADAGDVMTNDASTRKRSRRKVATSPGTEVALEQEATEGTATPVLAFAQDTLPPDALARALRAVAAELERDPQLARRVTQAMAGGTGEAHPTPTDNMAPAPRGTEPPADEESVAAVATIGRTFKPTIVTGVTPDLGPGVPDPFALRERLGESGLHAALESLRLGSLRAIVREYGLDPSGRLSKLNDAEKLREHILRATGKRK